MSGKSGDAVINFVLSLPKWAQQRIEQLEADKMYWQEKAMGATSPGLRDTNVVLVDTSHR